MVALGELRHLLLHCGDRAVAGDIIAGGDLAHPKPGASRCQSLYFSGSFLSTRMVSWKAVKCFTAACASAFTWEEEVQEEEEEEVQGAVQDRAVLSAPWPRGRDSLAPPAAARVSGPQVKGYLV